MEIRQAYDIWSEQYDTNVNRTRDLEALSLRKTLDNIRFDSCLEIGCGTGKNSEWLLTKAKHITAVDISEGMLAVARTKISSEAIHFLQADINKDWTFADRKFDLICFSLVLEHIENLSSIFRQVSRAITSGGYVYIGELHPFKQYSGTKAKFDTAEGRQLLECYNHHVSDFIQIAKRYDLKIIDVNEYFDDDDRTTTPRILTLLFTANSSKI